MSKNRKMKGSKEKDYLENLVKEINEILEVVKNGESFDRDQEDLLKRISVIFD